MDNLGVNLRDKLVNNFVIHFCDKFVNNFVDNFVVNYSGNCQAWQSQTSVPSLEEHSLAEFSGE